MIHRYRELVLGLGLLLGSLGCFLIYDALTNALHSDSLYIILGACSGSLALILFYNLLLHLRDRAEPEQEDQK
jgi:sulfite exporter TauE/SafE